MMSLKSRLLVVCVVFCSMPGFAGEAQWVEVRSPNFSVITDAGEKRGREVALHFEQMRSVFGSLMNKADVNLPVPLQIVAFRNKKEIEQIAPLFNGKPTDVAGLFQGGEDINFIMLDMSAENAWSAVFHEYAHRLMDGNLFIRPDPWLEEGFAEYFSSIEVDSKEARVGKVPDQTYLILRNMGWMRVSDLLQVQQDTKTYNESGDRRTTFYAESSLLVHYIYDNHLMPKVAVYFQARREQKKTLEESLQAGLGMNAGQLDSALRAYERSARYYYYRIPTPQSILSAQFTVTPRSDADARALLADIHAHSRDYRDRAASEFQDVVKSDPNHEAALRGLGYIAMGRREFGQAAEYLRSAVEKDAKDPRAHYYYGMLLSYHPKDDEDTAKAEQELESAIALSPSVAETYSALAYLQNRSGESDKAIASMTKAVKLAPTNDRYLLNLGNTYLAAGKPDPAAQIFRVLDNSTYPGVAQQASAGLQQAASLRVSTNSKPAVAPPQIIVAGGTGGSAMEPENSEDDEAVQVPPGPPVHFLRGRLAAVDCSAEPQAVLTVAAGDRSVKVHIADRARVPLIGADQFSCAWKDRTVAVNYRDRPDGDGDAVSIEMH